MTATFSADLSNNVSKVRQFLGDTDITVAKVQDETINAYLGSLSVELTAAQLADDLAASYADRVDTAIERDQTRNSQLYDHYTKLAGRLRKLAGKNAGPTPDAGFSGISVGGVCGDDPWTPFHLRPLGYDQC